MPNGGIPGVQFGGQRWIYRYSPGETIAMAGAGAFPGGVRAALAVGYIAAAREQWERGEEVEELSASASGYLSIRDGIGYIEAYGYEVWDGIVIKHRYEEVRDGYESVSVGVSRERIAPGPAAAQVTVAAQPTTPWGVVRGGVQAGATKSLLVGAGFVGRGFVGQAIYTERPRWMREGRLIAPIVYSS
jgi:hypothetical protein